MKMPVNGLLVKSSQIKSSQARAVRLRQGPVSLAEAAQLDGGGARGPARVLHVHPVHSRQHTNTRKRSHPAHTFSQEHSHHTPHLTQAPSAESGENGKAENSAGPRALSLTSFALLFTSDRTSSISPPLPARSRPAPRRRFAVGGGGGGCVTVSQRRPVIIRFVNCRLYVPAAEYFLTYTANSVRLTTPRTTAGARRPSRAPPRAGRSGGGRGGRRGADRSSRSRHTPQGGTRSHGRLADAGN